MPDAGERAYAYAKACGIIGRSFVGRRISALAGPHSLSELDRLIFPDVYRELPGRELLNDLEGRILRRTVQQILAVINSYSHPPELLIRQLRACEYADLKTCLQYLAGGTKTLPAINNIGQYGTIHFEAFPDLAAMLNGTEFEFLLEKNLETLQSADFDTTPLEAEIDLRYYTLLVQSILRLSPDDRLFAERILAEEISLRNCVWVLRLRSYFKKSAAETAVHLMDIKMRSGIEAIPGSLRDRVRPDDSPGREISLAAEAVQSLELPLDSRSEWRGWRWERLLNPEKPGEMWKADPRYFQNAASEYLYRLSLRCFRRMPFSISMTFCYIKLKQFEEDLLTSITEGLGLGMPGRDVFELLEVSP